MTSVLSAIARDPPLIAVVVLWLAVVELAKAARWRVLFGSGRPGYGSCLRALVIGQIANQLSPLRAGEAVRLGVIAAQGAPVVSATAAMATAKALDVFCLATIAVAVAGAAALGQGRLALAGAGAVVGVGVALALSAERARRWLDEHGLARRLRLASVVDVARTLRDPATVAVVLGTTALVWLCGLAANGTVLQAVGTAPTWDLAARVLVLGYLVGMLPAPPARLGVYEAGVVAALTSGGVPMSDAIAAAIALHACQFAELGALLLGSLVWVRRAKFA